jgi:hypothetical protein
MASATRPITDSPWFWAYAFGAGAIVAIALIGPKYGQRQKQIERQFEGRERVAIRQRRRETNRPPGDAPAAAGRRLIPLEPLFLVLAAITILAWAVFWRTHIARRSEAHKARSPDARGSGSS